MWPGKPWLWWELWWRTAMLPWSQAMAAASRKPPPAEEETDEPQERRRSREDFLARRLRTELEVKSVEDLIEGEACDGRSGHHREQSPAKVPGVRLHRPYSLRGRV